MKIITNEKLIKRNTRIGNFLTWFGIAVLVAGIYIFRQPHLELGLPPDELRDEIARTLIHEVAHYFGIDDDHLDEIGWG